jgi:hypothetical protein
MSSRGASGEKAPANNGGAASGGDGTHGSMLRKPRPLPVHAPKAVATGAGFWPKVKVICPWVFKGGVYKTMMVIHTAVALSGKRPN